MGILDALIPHENKQLSTEVHPPAYVEVAGLNQLNPDDFSLPALKLTQAQSKIENNMLHLGEFYRKDTGAFIKNPRLLVIGIARSRALLPKFGGESNTPLCRSDDSLHPRIEFSGNHLEGIEVNGEITAATIPAKCADCPFSQWGENNEKPRCSQNDNWAALAEDGDPVIMRLGGMGTKASAQLKNMARAAALKRRPLYVELSSRLEEDKKGKYFIPLVKDVSHEAPPELLEMAQSLAGLNLAARAAASVEQADAVDGHAE